jgi:hypothetical protein
MPPLLSVPEWDGDNITPKFDVFMLDKNGDGGAMAANFYLWHASSLDGVPREH